MRRPAVLLLAAILLTPPACSTPEEKLVDRRHELRTLLERIHKEYAGKGEKGEARTEQRGIFGRLTTGVGRSHFEQYCLAVGRGERPFSLSARLEEFMSDEDHVEDCRDAAELDAKIEELEREVAERAGR